MRKENFIGKEIYEIIKHSLLNPYNGKDSVSVAINAEGIVRVSASAVAKIWKMYCMETYPKRIQAAITIGRQKNPVVANSMAKIFERDVELNNRIFRPGFNKKGPFQLHCTFPGQVGLHDILKFKTGLGFVYQQTFIDAYTLMAFAKVYFERNGVVTINFLKDDVFPMYSANGIKVDSLYIMDAPKIKGDEDYGNYIDYLDSNGYEDKIGNSKYRIAVRKRFDDGLLVSFRDRVLSTFYSGQLTVTSLDVLQKKLDRWIEEYNDAPNERRYCYGKSPLQTFRDSLHLGLPI